MEKRKRIVCLLGGAMYALMASFGYQAEHALSVNVARALLIAALLTVPAAALLRLLFGWDERRAQSPRDGEAFCATKAFLFILACYVPMFLIAFPGSFAYDVPFQLEQVFTGNYSTHHPLTHTLLMGACVKLGHLLGHINLGAALYTLIQTALLAACFALACASIARQSGARAAKIATACFALYPLHMMMAVNATKDVLFSGLLALTLALAREMLCCKTSRRLGARLALLGAGMLLLRNNALYAAAVWLALLALLCRKGALRLIGAMLAAVALYMGAGGALEAATGAAAGDLSEMLSWPIQQMARARNLYGERLTQAEKDAIDALMPGEAWRLYDETISDPVKFEFDTQELKRDPGTYAKTYLSVARKCPQAYVDALLKHTYAFWYPYSEYRVSGYYLQMGISDQYYDWCDFERISSKSLVPKVLGSLSWRFGAKGAMQIPVIGWLFNMGLIVWVMLFFVIREAYLGRWKSFAVALLPVLLWGTFLLGPVMAGRYIYPFVCVLPVLASHPKAA